jgi:hypothetical protein
MTFKTVSGIQRESQAVLNSIKENDFHGSLEAWEKMTGSLDTFPRRLFWRRWQPNTRNISFFDLVRELSDIRYIP